MKLLKPPFSGSSDQPCVDTGTFTRGLSTGGTVGGTGSGLYRLPVSAVPVKKLVLWLNANFRTGFRKRKFGEKPGTFDLLNAKK